MSADLFAEFEDPSLPTAQPAAPSTGYGAAPTQQNAFASDPFASFGTSAVKPVTSATTQNQQSAPWPSFQGPQHHPTPQQGQDVWGAFTQPNATGPTAQQKTNDEDEDDGWGDFEVAENKPPAPAVVAQASALPKQSASQAFNIGQPIRPSQPVPSASLELLGGITPVKDVGNSNWLQHVGEQPRNVKPHHPTKAPRRKPSNLNPNVLFDADDFEGGSGGFEDDEDDFGDFETVKPGPEPDLFSDDYLATERPVKEGVSQAFADLSFKDNKDDHRQVTNSVSGQKRNAPPRTGLQSPARITERAAHGFGTSIATARSSGIKPSSSDAKSPTDDWGSFDEIPSGPKQTKETKPAEDGWDWDALDTKPSAKQSTKPAVQTYKATSTTKATDQSKDSSWEWDSFDAGSDAAPKTTTDEPPPTNVPPPSILLSVFPQLLGQANEALYKPVGGQSISVKNRILSDPKTVEYVRAYLLLAIVAARVISGRKVRWHRDKFLAQGMSISAAGAKGMKLAGVDKTQATREDREAADILDIWRDQVGRLRSAVAAVNASLQNSLQHLKIPDLRDNMAIQTAKEVPTAAKACVICGLKREERLLRVDFDVEDSFGEWWTDHWGHTTCKRFWLEHKDALRSR